MIKFVTIKPYLSNFCKINNQLRLNKIVFSYSKKKKIQLTNSIPSIHVSKYKDQHQGFLIYENNQSNKIKYITLIFIGCFLSGYLSYNKTQDYQIKLNYIILGSVSLIPFFIYLTRTGNTLKRLVLDNTGQNIIISRFKLGGFTQQTTKAKVQVLKGVKKSFFFGGIFIEGGGFYGFEKRKYWFHSKYILQPSVFDGMTRGRNIKIQKLKIKN